MALPDWFGLMMLTTDTKKKIWISIGTTVTENQALRSRASLFIFIANINGWLWRLCRTLFMFDVNQRWHRNARRWREWSHCAPPPHAGLLRAEKPPGFPATTMAFQCCVENNNNNLLHHKHHKHDQGATYRDRAYRTHTRQSAFAFWMKMMMLIFVAWWSACLEHIPPGEKAVVWRGVSGDVGGGWLFSTICIYPVVIVCSGDAWKRTNTPLYLVIIITVHLLAKMCEALSVISGMVLRY